MILDEKYKFHRKIRYVLALPMVFLFSWWIYGMSWAILLSIKINSYLQTIISCFITVAFMFFALKYLYNRYKVYLYSRLFIKNPSLSIFIFTIENLSLCILYFSFLFSYFIGGLTGNSGISVVFAFFIAPICISVFIISYMFNERKIN